MDIQFGIIAVDVKREVIAHFIGFEEQPNLQDFIEIYKELQEDKEFGLTDQMEDIFLFPASDAEVEEFRKDIPKDASVA